MTPARLRLVVLSFWVAIVAGAIYVVATRGDLVRDETLVLSSYSTLLAGAIYLAVGCVRGFTLVPVTYLIPFGLLFLGPWLQLGLTLAGVMVSSASIYYFSEHLHLAEYFERHHARGLERLRSLLRRNELPIVIAWSFFPFVPTDAICYVCGALEIDIRKLLLGVLVGEGVTCAAYIFLGRELVSFVL